MTDQAGSPSPNASSHEPWITMFDGFIAMRKQTAEFLQKAMIWVTFFGLLYVMRQFFALIFLTFILCFISTNVSHTVQRTFPALGRRTITLGWYLVVIGIVSLLSVFVVPRIYEEGQKFITRIPDIYDAVMTWIENARSESDQFNRAYTLLVGEQGIEDFTQSYIPTVVEGIRSILGHALEAIWVFILSLLFSFLILWDMPALWMEISFIQKTRLAQFYNQTKETIVTFAHVLGRVFQAQLMIAIANTILTLVGLAILRLPDVMFLSIIVFFASFVPVLGVFVSTAPMALLAFNLGGFPRFLGVIVMILIIHFLETYFLNPHIYGARMKINPVLVLVILLIGHHFFHVWGVLLGVPVFYYISRYAIRYPKDRPPLEPKEKASVQ